MARLVDAPLEITFSEFHENEEMTREFNLLSESDEDPVGQWLKLARARGETSESDQVLLTLVVELHRKVDELSALLKDEKVEYLSLASNEQIEKIGFDEFYIKNPVFSLNRKYYGRISMPVFPKREIPVFFEATSENLASIKRLHERDRKDWNSYVTARERVMIRQMRAEKDEH